jgi:C1A family cysteine protease
MLIEL